MSDLFDYDNKLSNLAEHDNKNCKSCIEYEDRLIKQLNELKIENKTLKEFVDKLDEEFGKNVEPTLSEKADNIIALYRTNKKYCEIADEKIKDLQSQLDQANERLKGLPKFGIGQKVYYVRDTTFPIEIDEIQSRQGNFFYVDYTYNEIFKESELVATREEAQAKLKEIQENE